jgi:hypothetical protein
MAAPEAKLLPFTVSVNAGPPAVAELGFKEAITGGGLTLKAAAFEVIHPAVTVMDTAPGLARRAAGTAAVSFVPLTAVVASAVAFQSTVAPAGNVPFTVRAKAGPPAMAELGLTDVIIGGGMTVNARLFETTPPEDTVTLAGPAAASTAPETGAVK